MYATLIQARYTPLISFLPNLGLALILLVGGREVIHGSLTIGEFTAFYAYLLMLISPMRTLGYMLSAAQRATASGARIFQVLDRAPRITSPEDAPALPAGPGRVSLPRRQPDLRRRRRTRRCTNVDLEIERRRDGRARGRDGLGQDDARVAASAALRRHRGHGPDRRRRRPLGRPARACARRSRSSPTTRSCSRPRSTRTSPTRAPTPRARRSSGRPRVAQATGSSRALPQGLRHAGRRARPDPVGRPAPADRDRPRDRSPTRGS